MKRQLGADGSGAQSSPRLADGIYTTLLNRLISQEIRPGERITVDGVSRDLQVSQTPVREALTRLASDGLVVNVHLVGYRATTQLSRERFESLFDLRLLLEPDAAAKAAKLRTDRQVAAMAESNERMAHLADGIDPPTYGDFAVEDATLHDLIAEAAGNEFVRESLTRAHPHLHLFRLHFNARVSADAIAEHKALIDAIVAGSSSQARAVMRQHLQRSRARLRSAFD